MSSLLRTKEYLNLMSFPKKAERHRICAKMRAAKERKRLAGPAPDYGPLRVPAGVFLGTLTWLDASGAVHRWTIKQGPRRNNIEVHAKGRAVVCGWDRLLCRLRKRLAVPKVFNCP